MNNFNSFKYRTERFEPIDLTLQKKLKCVAADIQMN